MKRLTPSCSLFRAAAPDESAPDGLDSVVRRGDATSVGGHTARDRRRIVIDWASRVRVDHRWLALIIVIGGSIVVPGRAIAQGIGGNFGSVVGGIAVDPQGIVSTLAPAASTELAKERERLLKDSQLNDRKESQLRMVSLRGIIERIEASRGKQGGGRKGADDTNTLDMLLLGSLTRVTHILVDEESKDIVLAGPGEAPKVDPSGAIVAAKTGWPLLRLEDLAVALVAVDAMRDGGIQCSIDPTQDGIERIGTFLRQQRSIGADPEAVFRGMEEALGPQTVRVAGVPADSRFAHVLVAADHRLKQIGMGLRPSGVRDVPSYVTMLPAGSAGGMVLPRFWLEPVYEPILRDADELGWQIGRRNIRCLTQNDLAERGQAANRVPSADAAARKWCDRFTESFPSIAGADPVFAELVNCIDLSVVAALIKGRQLDTRAGLDLAPLTSLVGSPDGFPTYAVPRSIDTVATGMKKGNVWVLTASGGVLAQPWSVVANPVESADLADVRAKALAKRAESGWFWE